MNTDRRKIYFIGPFEGKIGGVTSKNKNLYFHLKDYWDISKVDTLKIKKISIANIAKLIYCLLFFKGTLLIGVSTVNGRNRWLTKLLFMLNKKTMRQSLFFVMGGTLPKILESDPKYLSYMKNYKMIYVETKGMINKMESLGAQNISYFPNCRSRPSFSIEPLCNYDRPLKTIFFSLIYPEKGTDTILEAAKRLPGCLFDFYGEISESYRDIFLKQIGELPNCHYKGVFISEEGSVYKLLNQYDVLLFPTRMKTEGVPGCVIEAKISAAAIIATDIAYNRELICNDQDGIILSCYDPKALEEAIKKVDGNRDYLFKLKQQSFLSAENYYFEKYINNVVNLIESKPERSGF